MTDKQVAHGRNLSPDQFGQTEIRLTDSATAARNYTDSRIGRAFSAPDTVTRLDPHTLHPTQPIVYADQMQNVKDGHASEKPITVIRHMGKDYIRDGHHRAVIAMQRGRKVAAHVVDVAANIRKTFG